MNYLTNYYKNLCEQLQERINILEARIRSPEEMMRIGGAEAMDAASDEPNPNPKINAGSRSWRERADKRRELIRNAMGVMGDVAASGDAETARAIGDVMYDMGRHTGYGKVAGLRDMDGESDLPPDLPPYKFVNEPGPSMRDMALAGEEKIRGEALAARQQGKPVAVPADIAAMRRFIQAGRGRYNPPYPQPTDLNPDGHDGPDTDTTASSMEVAASQQRRQLSQQKPDYWFGNTRNRL